MSTIGRVWSSATVPNTLTLQVPVGPITSSSMRGALGSGDGPSLREVFTTAKTCPLLSDVSCLMFMWSSGYPGPERMRTAVHWLSLLPPRCEAKYIDESAWLLH